MNHRGAARHWFVTARKISPVPVQSQTWMRGRTHCTPFHMGRPRVQ
jgi:hypothetical protein